MAIAAMSIPEFLPRIREQLFEVLVDNACAAIKVFHLFGGAIRPTSPGSGHVSAAVVQVIAMALLLPPPS